MSTEKLIKGYDAKTLADIISEAKEMIDYFDNDVNMFVELTEAIILLTSCSDNAITLTGYKNGQGKGRSDSKQNVEITTKSVVVGILESIKDIFKNKSLVSYYRVNLGIDGDEDFFSIENLTKAVEYEKQNKWLFIDKNKRFGYIAYTILKDLEKWCWKDNPPIKDADRYERVYDIMRDDLGFELDPVADRVDKANKIRKSLAAYDKAVKIIAQKRT